MKTRHTKRIAQFLTGLTLLALLSLVGVWSGVHMNSAEMSSEACVSGVMQNVVCNIMRATDGIAVHAQAVNHLLSGAIAQGSSLAFLALLFVATLLGTVVAAEGVLFAIRRRYRFSAILAPPNAGTAHWLSLHEHSPSVISRGR